MSSDLLRPIRTLPERGLLPEPSKAWRLLRVPPRDEWQHSGGGWAVGGPLFPRLMALAGHTTSRRSLLTGPDSGGIRAAFTGYKRYLGVRGLQNERSLKSVKGSKV